MHFKYTALVYLNGKPYKTNENDDSLSGRQVCSFVYLKGKPYKTNGNLDILRGRQGQSRKSASAGSFTHRIFP